MIAFQCRSYGKWILAGEHSVLRGSPALVFPLRSRVLELEYHNTSQPLELKLEGEHGQELQLLVWGVLEKACEQLKISRSDLNGLLHLHSSLPVGAGMGASAALCVALSRWLGHLGYIKAADFYEFSRQLENLFHGESSGVDIAVALSGEGLRFLRHGEQRTIKPSWTPKLYISYSGKRGVTVDAVSKVKDLLAQNPAIGERIDLEMMEAVAMAEKALAQTEEAGLPLLAKALERAGHCFVQWGLNEGAPDKHIAWLRESGALAVKPTGSGGGGYVLSLWDNEPSAKVAEELIACL
jgi:mevalonate kinase